MFSRRKAVYGKSRHQKEAANLLWDEAIGASPIVPKSSSIIDSTPPRKLVIAQSPDNSPERPVEMIKETQILRPADPNAMTNRKSTDKKGQKIPSQIPKIRPQVVEVDLSLLDPPPTPVKQSQDLSLPLMSSTPLQIPVHTFFGSDASNRESLADLSGSSSLSSAHSLQALEDAFKGLATTEPNLEVKETIEALLQLCGQAIPESFDHFTSQLLTTQTIRKLGEASFSEVFLSSVEATSESTVLKIIPFGDEEGEAPIHDIVQELRISKAMTTVKGFVKVKSMKVVQGKYPDALLEQWDLWNSEHESESERPDWYKETQRYCIVSLEHGGLDLEHFEIQSWDQARSIFLEIAATLAKAEEYREFEHRDLHWGNILIRENPTSEQSRITIIDYTLSRAKIDNSQVAYYGFADQAVFEAEDEDYQFEIYRLMRDTIAAEDGALDWKDFNPVTNVLWLHYVVDKLLYAKHLKKPATRTTKRTPILDQAEIEAYSNLESTWHLLNPRRRYGPDELPIESACRVIELLE